MTEDTNADARDNMYAAPWKDDGDMELNVIGVMISVLNDARDWGPLDIPALNRVRDYMVSKINDEINKAKPSVKSN